MRVANKKQGISKSCIPPIKYVSRDTKLYERTYLWVNFYIYTHTHTHIHINTYIYIHTGHQV